MALRAWRGSWPMACRATMCAVAVGGPWTRVHAIARPHDRGNARAHHAANAGESVRMALELEPTPLFTSEWRGWLSLVPAAGSP